MKWLLAKAGLPKAIGMYLDGDTLILSQVVSTPWGPIELAGCREDVATDDLSATLRRLLPPLLGRGRIRRAAVAIGLPSERTCFLTRPVQVAASDTTPEVLLHEALRSSSISISEMVVDVVHSEPDKRPVAGIASCNKKYLKRLLGALEELGVRPHRAEPAPCALLRIAVGEHRSRRSVKVVVRLFLGETRVLAVLAVGNQPITWRHADLPRGDEAATLLSVSRCVLAVKNDCGIESPLDAVVLHGRPALRRLLDVAWIEQRMDVAVEWCEQPALDGSRVAYGLALGCLRPDRRAFDLSRSLKPRASMRELFPWRDVALQMALLVFMALFLFERFHDVDRAHAAVRLQNAQCPWAASAKEADLEQEKKELTQKVAAVEEFLGTRIVWTSYERDLSEHMPPEVFLGSFAGVYELKLSGKKKGYAKPKRELVLRGAAWLAHGGLVPHEIDDFLDALREHPMLRRDFPIVELADLKEIQRSTTETPARDVYGRLPAQVCRNSRQGGRRLRLTQVERAAYEVKTGKSTIDYARLIERLYDPVQLRVFVTGVMLAIAYVGIQMPLGARIDETTLKLGKERKRQALADDIQHLREQVELFESRLPEKTDTNEWVQYVLRGIRKHPMKVVNLDSDETRSVGPYQAVVMRIELEGAYRDLDWFLSWLEGNERFFRMDSVRIAPTRQSITRLNIQMRLLGLKR